MSRNSAIVSSILFLALFAALPSSTGLAREASAQKDPEPYVASFSYTPDFRAAPGSGGATFALGSVVFVSNEATIQGADWRSAGQFSRLHQALKDDLSELLAAKGFSVRGPFDTYDLIPYPEKKQIDFYLIPTLELFATWKDTNVETEGNSLSGKVYRGTGTIEVSGNLTIKLEEVTTRELMWTKRIPISYSFPYDVRFPYFEKGSRPFDMKLVMNDLAKGLENQYPLALGTLSNLVDPEEMRVLKRQALTLKRKKGY